MNRGLTVPPKEEGREFTPTSRRALTFRIFVVSMGWSKTLFRTGALSRSPLGLTL